MKRQLLVVSILVSGVLGSTAVQAHNPAYQSDSHGGLTGNISIWSGSPYGTGYSGNVGYGRSYSPAPPYAGAHFYPACNHWHPQGYRAPKRHAYGNAYAHGYADNYDRGHKSYKGHKKSKHKRGHGYDNGHDRGHDRGHH